jgi:hypothetical protein
MQRGKSQVLFNYLPGSTFDYEGGSAICRVTRVEGEEIREISKSRIFMEMERYIYGTSSTPRWMDRAKRFPRREEFYKNPDIHFTFITPKRVYFDLFPLVFRCLECGRVYEYEDIHELMRKNSNLACLNNCGKAGLLRQIYHVFVHECGKIEQLRVPECDTHGKKHIALDEMRSQRAKDFRWVCLACGNREVGKVVRKCSCDGTANMTLTPHRANMTYYPHYVSIVDIGDDPKLDLSRDKVPIVKEYLGYGSGLTDSDKKLVSMLEERAFDPGLDEELRTYLQKTLQKLTEAADPGARELSSSKKLKIEAVPDDAIYEITEYNFVMSRLEPKPRSIDEGIDIMKRQIPGSQGKLEAAKNVIKRCGFDDVLLIERFPVVTAVFGYTRVSFEPESRYDERVIKTTIWPFPKKNGKFPIFVDRSGTEALMFKLDFKAVAEWLIKNDIPVNAESDNEEDLKLWFLSNVGSFSRFERLTIDDGATYYVFNLLHSLSHVLISASARLSGFEAIGISEYIFPRELSFIIYSNKTDFTIGGFHTLFEQYLPELFTSAVTNPEFRTCVYDPVCRDNGGACHACLFLPEVSCRYFNRNLSRVFLFGGAVNGREIVGFFPADIGC